MVPKGRVRRDPSPIIFVNYERAVATLNEIQAYHIDQDL